MSSKVIPGGQPSAAEHRAFGVGCWEFGLDQPIPFRFVANDYAQQLQKRLECIPTVNNIRIPVTEDEKDYEVNEDSLRDYQDTRAFFPFDAISQLQFDLYVPFRIQEDLIGTRVRETGTERFRVHMRYTYFGPVAFIELLNNKRTSDPSTGVRIVREYLTRELADGQDNIVFDPLGPSPFHGDFFLESLPPDAAQIDFGLFDLENLQLPGYTELTFRYRIRDFPDQDDPLEFLFDEIADELGFFYEICRRDKNKYRLWGEVEELLRAVTEEDKISGWLKRLKLALSRGRDVAKLHNLIADFETLQVFDRHGVERQHRHIYNRDTAGFLKSFLDSALQDRPVFPVQQVVNLVTFVEGRRSKAVEFLVLIVAAVIGGIAGSLITLAIG